MRHGHCNAIANDDILRARAVGVGDDVTISLKHRLERGVSAGLYVCPGGYLCDDRIGGLTLQSGRQNCCDVTL